MSHSFIDCVTFFYNNRDKIIATVEKDQKIIARCSCLIFDIRFCYNPYSCNISYNCRIHKPEEFHNFRWYFNGSITFRLNGHIIGLASYFDSYIDYMLDEEIYADTINIDNMNLDIPEKETLDEKRIITL